ncbi:hypothetical protein H2LOC_005075 [Methylocystis heyeri]|uniref:Uncharacterized protein n=2 Tax=Methylocystis heyeri TaxID=391905 RepID=A0A6B8KJY1_9HYPH|nr:hypothetical protein H2LOC_005075 [Methylocystis heyeri]
MAPVVAREIISLIEDRRALWACFNAEFPDRVRGSLDDLRYRLTSLRGKCAAGGPLDSVIAALGKTIRHFFDTVEQYNLTTLRCDSRDPDWRAFETALKALRKSVAYQISALADSYAIPLQGELADCLPRYDSPSEPSIDHH